MDRPRAGAGQHQAGAITVVDLIRRHQGPVRVPSADEVDTASFVGDLLGGEPAEAEPQRGWVTKAAKLIGLAAGSLVLCGSVVAASTLAHERRSPAPNQIPVPAPEVSGAGVLRPDTLLAQLTGSERAPSPDPKAGPPTSPPTPTAPDADRADDGAGQPRGVGASAAGRGAPTPAHTVSMAGTGPIDPVAVVREFYALAGSEPAQAASLLDPALLAADPLGFTRSWHSVRQVRVASLRSGPNDTVRAVIELLQADGTWLQVVELLHVTPGSTPVINGAQLLSAQRG